MTFFGLGVLLLLVVFSGHQPTSIAIDSPAIMQLAPGSTLRREISAGATEVFEITIEQGRLLRFSIDKGDLVLSTSVYDPTRVKLLEHISQELEIVEISLPADQAGNYKIELRSPEQLKEGRAYELKVEPFANVSATDRKDSDARHLLAQAEVLRANWTAPDLRQAKASFDQAAQIWESITNFSNASIATLKAGDVCFRLSEFTEAGKRYKNAEAFAKKAGDPLLQGKALSWAGVVYSYLGDNYQGQTHVASAVDLLKSAAKDSNLLARSAYGEALANMAEVNYSKGDLEKAFEQLKEARKYLEQDRKAQAKVHRFSGYTNGSLGILNNIESETSRARDLSLAINDKAGEGLALTLLGLFHSFTGKKHSAIELHKTALNIFRSIGDRHSEAIALNALGQAHQVFNDYPNAIINTETALGLFESVGALDSVAVATFKLAELYQQSGKHEQALRYLERSLALSRAAKKVRNEANALSEIAIVYASQKRPELAEKQQRKAQKFYEGINDRRGLATSLNKYGDFLLRIDQKQQALDAFSQALAWSEEVEEKGLLTDTLHNLARANQAVGNYEAGLDNIERSIKIIEDLRSDVGSPDLRALYFSGVIKHYDLCRDILMQLDKARPGQGFAERAFLVSEKSRSRSLLDLVRESQSHLREGAAVELLRSEREVGGLIRALSRYQMELFFDKEKALTEGGDVSRRLAELQSYYQEIQVKLREQNSKLIHLEDFAVMDVKQVQRELRASDRMLLQYALGEDQSYLWAITSDSFHSYVLPSRKNIEPAAVEVSELIMARAKSGAAADDYRAKVDAADKLYSEKARDLSQMLLGPVADQLRNRRLIFVTEGALQRVQFESLPVPQGQTTGPTASQEFLIQTNEIAAIPSMTTLLAMRATGKRPASPGKLVAIIADPVFNRNDDRVIGPEQSPAVVRTASLSSTEQPALLNGPSRLVYASEEADSILAVAPRGTTMVAKGFDASRETAMSQRVGEYQIIHFATHGFFDSEHPELSGILLTNVDKNGVARDGLIALHDIYTLDLSAELTVLSACQTALGKDVKGEGLVGLTHSFMSAGSKSVVASLWKVDDQATAALMSDFYQSMFREGMPPVAALRAAKLKMMQNKRWQAPYYWAGFVFQGDYESRINVGSNSQLFLGVSLLFVALAFCGLIVFLRRRRRLSPRKRN
jgi:CHAT domain-containing protein/predicted negative regulator of RcsB-dependent stress response